MPERPGDAERIIRSIAAPGDVKNAAVRAFYDSPTEQDLVLRLDAIEIPDATKGALFNLRFGAGRATPTLAPTLARLPARPQSSLPETMPEDIARLGLSALPLITSGIATAYGGPLAAGPGAVLGEIPRKAIAQATGLEPPTPREAEPVGRKKTYWEELPPEVREALGTAAEYTAAEYGGRLLLGTPMKAAGRLVGGPFRPAATLPENLAVKEANEQLRLGLTAGQVAGRTTAGEVGKAFEFYGETGLFGRPVAETAKSVGRKAGETAIDRAVDAISSNVSAEGAGKGYMEAMTTGRRLLGEGAQPLFDEVDKLIGQAAVDMRPVQAVAKRRLEEFVKQMPGAGPSGIAVHYPTLGQPTAGAARIMNNIIGGPEVLTFGEAQRLRTLLMSVGREENELFVNQAQSVARDVTETLTRTMETSASKIGPNATQAWRTARDFWIQGHNVFERSIVPSLLKKNPEEVVGAIKPGAVTDAKAMKRAILGYAPLGTPQEREAAKRAWDDFGAAFIRRNLLREPEGVGLGDMDIFGLKQRLGAYGEPTLKEVLSTPNGAAALERLKVIGEAFSRVRRDAPFVRTYQFVEMARALYQLGTAGVAIGAGMTRGVEAGIGAAVAMETLPYVVARIAYSPRATKYFLDGISAFLPEVAKVPTQATTDFLLFTLPKTSGLLGRAGLVAAKDYMDLQEARRGRQMNPYRGTGPRPQILGPEAPGQ